MDFAFTPEQTLLTNWPAPSSTSTANRPPCACCGTIRAARARPVEGDGPARLAGSGTAGGARGQWPRHGRAGAGARRARPRRLSRSVLADHAGRHRHRRGRHRRAEEALAGAHRHRRRARHRGLARRRPRLESGRDRDSAEKTATGWQLSGVKRFVPWAPRRRRPAGPGANAGGRGPVPGRSGRLGSAAGRPS